MKTIRSSLAIAMAGLLAMQPWLLTIASATGGAAPSEQAISVSQDATAKPEPRALTGFLDDRRAEMRAETRGEHDEGYEGGKYPEPALANLPIIDAALSSKSRQIPADETLRLIIHLDYLPHAEVFEDATNRYKTEIDELETDRQAFLERQAALRNTSAKIDAENYATMFAMDDADRQELREIGERNESLSTRIKDDVSAELKTLIDAYQAPVVEQIEKLGGNVEFTMIAGNTIVATMPAASINDLAQIPGVMRVVEDSLMEGYLNIADNATMVDPADTSLSGLWDSGADGGIYDPAIIDSGLDLTHPGMRNSTVPLRDNFGSWYLVAANGSASFNDIFSQDDLQGHGTHVAGIVGSYGAPGYTTHLGMSHGVDKLVNLKAGWRNTAGTASMFWSDKYNLVDRALYNTVQLQGGTFADDVDGMNLSYGGSTTLDDTDGGRFWDSVISTYPDLPVTISAGNSGPSNTLFNDPATSYNAIAVANFNDRGTTSLTDDIISSSSTVGPTANGRRKPDLAAPGTSISAPNTFWETQADYVNKSGTSMAAPMVLGVIMDLNSAAVFDHLAVKALLINTAQKNRAGMNIENDADGWDPALGFGALNAYAAYFHRFDTFIDSVAPRNTAGDFQLYMGNMSDEGASGEGRDRVTMVWDRPATYLTAATPSTFYSLSDLNLRLYNENSNFLVDFDTAGNDNVHQVRIGAGAGDTPVVVNAYAWSTAFNSGASLQEFALATEEGFSRVDHPATFSAFAFWPTEVEPNEVFTIEFWINNNSDLASHSNSYNLELPVGWTLVAGIDTQNVGSIAAGGASTHVIYTLRAPPTAIGAQNIVVKHSHNSYNEPYGDFNWNIGLTVAVDSTPPNPNPMGFSILPDDLSTTSMDMTASLATDLHSPVEYYLDYTSTLTGGLGGSDSGWQASRSWTDLGLGVNHSYCYRAWARDNANFPNLTTPSAISCAYTAQASPAGISFGAVTTTSVAAFSSSTPANLTLDSSGLLISNTTTGATSGWKQDNNPWTSLALAPATPYTFVANARNGDAETTPASPARIVHTLANPPAVDMLVTQSDSEIRVALNPNGNGSAAEYFIENTTAGTNSGWINDISWESAGLACETFYNFQARARNGDGVETIIVSLGLQTTGACITDSDSDGIPDNADNCTFVPNTDQRDTNGDGFGNICDADLDNNGIVNAVDLGLFKAVFFTADADADFNGDGIVNTLDLGLLKGGFFAPPGPSGIAP